jgi:hypothetical protein
LEAVVFFCRLTLTVGGCYPYRYYSLNPNEPYS